MSTRHNRPTKGNLALALAQGRTAASWARETGTPERTARRWAREAEVIRQVEAIRRKSIDRAIGTLSRQATAAATELARLARKAESEAVRLNACRGLLSDLLTVTDHQTLERRVTELENRSNAQPQG